MTVLDEPDLDELDFEPAPRVIFAVEGTGAPALPAPVTPSVLFPDVADVASSTLAGMWWSPVPEAHFDWQQQVSAALENMLSTTVPLPEGPFSTREQNLFWPSPEPIFPPSGFDVYSAVRESLADESVYFAVPHCYLAMCSPSRGAYWENLEKYAWRD